MAKTRAKKQAPPLPKRESPSAIVRHKAETISVGQAVEDVLIKGDLTPLSPEQRLEYYKAVCKSLGLNPLTRPFDYIAFKATENSPAKLVLYARKDCTEQLRKIRRISCTNVTWKKDDGLIIAEADVQDGTGRRDHGTGVVTESGLSGKDKANAIMKAETKAKRRATLSICGLGFLDESELDTLDEYGFVTPGGRIAFPEVPRTGSHEAAVSVAEEKIAKLKEGTPAEPAPLLEAPKAKETPPKGILEIDWAEESSPKLFGDLPAEVLEVLKKYVTLTEKDGFYRILPKDVETVRQFCEAANYRLVEHMPQKSSPVSAMSPGSKAAALGGGKDETKAPNTPAAAKKEEAVLVTGIIERVNHTTTANGKVMAYVTILSDKKKFDYSSWDKDINDELEKGKGKVATVFVKISGKYRNLVGLKNVGAKEFIDGKIPVIRKDREPGTKGLYD